jgi:hypothetical protein
MPWVLWWDNVAEFFHAAGPLYHSIKKKGAIARALRLLPVGPSARPPV